MSTPSTHPDPSGPGPTVSPVTAMTPGQVPAVWVIDLDGVVWRGTDPIPGSAEAIGRLQAAGHTVVFASNNSSYTGAELEAKLNGHGIRSLGHAVTSSQAASSLLHPGETVLVVGEAGVVEAVEAAGAVVRAEGPVDTVIVGITRRFDYAMLRRAARAIHGGARLIATNTDSTFPGPDGLDPGNGALVAAVATAGGRPPDAVAGKPNAPMVDLIRARYGSHGVMVGDRADTDGRFARALGYDFALVLSGVVTEADLPVEPSPRWLSADLARLVPARLDPVPAVPAPAPPAVPPSAWDRGRPRHGFHPRRPPVGRRTGSTGTIMAAAPRPVDQPGR